MRTDKLLIKTMKVSLILSICLLLCSECQAMSRKEYDRAHYLTHFFGHQALTNFYKVSNVNAAIICFAAGYGNEILDEFSKQGYFDKKGVFFDPYYGFDPIDCFKRNIIGFGSSWLLNTVLPDKSIKFHATARRNKLLLAVSINL